VTKKTASLHEQSIFPKGKISEYLYKNKLLCYYKHGGNLTFSQTSQEMNLE